MKGRDIILSQLIFFSSLVYLHRYQINSSSLLVADGNGESISSSDYNNEQQRRRQHYNDNNDWNCASMANGGDVEGMVQDAKRTIVLSPFKVGGISLHQFMAQCNNYNNYDKKQLKQQPQPYAMIHRSWERENITDETYQLFSSYDHEADIKELPNFLSDHVRSDKHFIDIIKTSPLDTLFIFLYRDDEERFISAVKHVIENRVCGDWEVHNDLTESIKARRIKTIGKDNIEEEKCIFEADSFIRTLSQKKRCYEICYGSNRDILTCELYDAIREHGPNLIFMNMNNIDTLQSLVAKKHCPNMLDKLPIHANSAAGEGEGTTSVNNIFTERSSSDSNIHDDNNLIPFREWLDSKKNWLQVGIRDAPWKCGSKTRAIDSTMKSCSDQAMIYNNNMTPNL